MRFRSISLFGSCLTLLAVLALRAQNTQLHPDQNPAIPTISYDRLWEAYTPQNVDITVMSTGTARYLSRNPLKPPDAKETNPDYSLEFTLSARSREKLFHDAGNANYFQGDFSFKQHAVASTGKKTLTYADQSRHFETSYDYSDNKTIQQITSLFEGISSTIEHERKLQYLHRYDRLGLEDELKGMENEGNNLAELQIIAPTLESIANDPAILNIARQRAKRLLAKAPVQ
jgi:hypothetical protein